MIYAKTNSHLTSILFLKYMCNHDFLGNEFGFLLPVPTHLTSKQGDQKLRKT